MAKPSWNWFRHQAVQEFSIGDSISLGFQMASVDKTLEALEIKGIALHSGPFQPALLGQVFFLMRFKKENSS